MKAKELAALLGVSQATISLVLNNKPGLSDGLRKKLVTQIEEMGYGYMLNQNSSSAPRTRSAGAGQAAASRGTERGSIVYLSYRRREQDWEDVYSFYAGVLEGAQQEAREINCNLVIMYRQCEEDLKEAFARTGHVLGTLVICPIITEEILAELKGLGVPYVFIDAFDPTPIVNSVNVDNRQSFYMIVDYLKKKGHRTLGYVSAHGESSSGEARRIAYRCALKDHGLRDHPDYYFDTCCEADEMDTTELERQLSQVGKLPSALIAENDYEAMRTIHALRRLGVRVPEDVSIVGFDDNPIARVTMPKLTTVRSSRHRIGRECVALILRLRRLAETDTLRLPMKITISTELVERDSVKER